MYEVVIGRKARKNTRKLPPDVLSLFFALVADLSESGPEQPTWHNFSKLGPNEYHCHLNYRYVACWTNQNGKLRIEVYYVGSRENAPY